MFRRKQTCYELPDEVHHSDEETQNYVRKHWWSPYLALLYTTVSSLAVLLASVIVAKISSMSVGQLTLIITLSYFAVFLPVAIYSTKNIFGPKEHFWLLVLRSLLNGSSLFLIMNGARLLPFAHFTIILSTVPALVTVASRIHLKEPCGSIQVVSIVFTALGVLLSVRLPEVVANSSVIFTKDFTTGLIYTTCGTLTVTYTFVCLRKLKSIHYSIILWYYGLFGSVQQCVLTFLTARFVWPHCDSNDIVLIFLLMISMLVCQIFLTWAVQLEMANIVSTFKAAIEIPIGAILQVVFFGTIPDLYTFGGGLLVIVAIVTLGLWKWLETLPNDSIHRKRFKYLLI